MTLSSKTCTEHDKNQVSIDKIVTNTVSALNNLNGEMSVQTQDDIAAIRNKSLQRLKQKKAQQNNRHWLTSIDFSLPTLVSSKLMLPMGLAASLIIGLLINRDSSQVIPEIPLAMITTDMPSEDITMLENLAFVTWLAEHEQDI
ncbi:MAG: hypothetical protein COB35_05700 [Gammaproteobacteria bacterium]|nr:MAG: hypothetical protein COB35_05700 [Gammaproteobacteria bacterium]